MFSILIYIQEIFKTELLNRHQIQTKKRFFILSLRIQRKFEFYENADLIPV